MDLIGEAKREILHRQAEHHHKSKSYRKALSEYEKLIKISLKEEDERQLAFYEDRLGDCYEKRDHHGHKERNDDHEEAGKYYITAGDRYRVLGEHEKAGEIFEKGAKAYEELDNFTKAAEFYKKSGIMFSDVGDYFNASYTFHNAAEYYEKDQVYGESAKMYQLAAVCDLKIKDKANASINFKQAAKNYEKAREWGKAIDSYAGSVEIDTLNRAYLDVADTYDEMAHAYYELNDQKNAVYYHLKAADLRFQNDDKLNAALSYREAGGVYKSMGEYDKAIEYFMKSAEAYYSIDNIGHAAACYGYVAQVYEEKGELVEAGKYLIEAAKAEILGKNEAMAQDRYQHAAEVLLKAAQSEKDPLEAAKLTFEAAQAYETIKSYSNAADAYNSYANLCKKAKDEEKARQGFRLAAEAYVSGGRIWDAAEANVNHEDYEMGAQLYDKYAESKIAEKDNYGIAIGYMESGNCHRRLNNTAVVKNKLDRAVSYFNKFIEGVKTQPKDPDTDMLIGDAYRKMGECHQWMMEYNKAQTYYQKAQDYYSKIEDEGRSTIAEALRLKIDAAKSIDHGHYQQAEKGLKDSRVLFEKAVKSGRWKQEYSKILVENMEECDELLDKIRLKPEIVLDIDRSSYTFAGIPLLLNLKLENNGKYTMKDITFLEHLPEDITLLKLPEKIEKVGSGEVKSSSIELTPHKTGSFRLKPIEVYYEDQKGHKYVKASNETLIEVVEKPPTDFKNYQTAVEVFKKYTESQISNRNWFQAGDGYRQMARVYGQFRSDSTLRDYHSKSVEQYIKYIKEHEGVEDKTQLKRLGDALWYAAQGLASVGELGESLKYYEKSVPIYRSCKMEKEAIRSIAFKLKAEATKHIKSGDYQSARKKLEESLSYFNELIKSGGFESQQIKQVEKSEDEVKSMLETMTVKPEIDVTVTCDPEAVLGSVIEFSSEITNPLEAPIKELRPVLKTAEGLEVVEQAKNVSEIQAGKKASITFKMKALKTGQYRFNPLDVAYKDEHGKSYMKGGNEVQVKVSEAEQEIAKKQEVSDETAETATPSVSLSYEGPIEAVVDQEVDVEGTLVNDGAVDVNGLRFIGNTTDEVEVTRAPDEIEGLERGAKVKLKTRFKTNVSGDLSVKLVELFYKDMQGKRYFKSSNPVAVKSKKA